MERSPHVVKISFFLAGLLLVLFCCAVSASADESIVYGESVPASFSGATWTGTAPDGTLPSVGSYASDLGTLTVKPCPITVTPDSKTKIVGAADPELTYTITSGSLVSGDTLSGALTRVSGETVGTYSILQGTLDNVNYDITFVSGKTLTISAASTTQDVTVSIKYSDSFSSREKIPDRSYGYSETPGLSVKLYQEEPSKSASLQFEAELTGISDYEPVTLYVALPDSFSMSKEYYIRRTSDGSDSRLSMEIERHGDYRYAVFTTSVVDDAAFRIIRKSSSSSSSSTSSFWEDVVEDIEDAEYGDSIRVKTGTRTNMAADVLRELKGLPVTLSLVRSSGQVIAIYGKDVGYISSSKEYFSLSELADEYGSTWPGTVIAASSPEESSSQAAVCAPSAPYVPAWTPAVPAPSVPATVSSSQESSVTSSEPPSSSELTSSTKRSSSEEESDVEIFAEEEDSSIESDAQNSTFTTMFPLFAVGSLAGAGLLAGGITAFVLRRRR